MGLDWVLNQIPLTWEFLAGAILATSPITSYLDTVLSIHRKKSSAGFSLDVCAIMLISSICRIYFYFGRPYELSLLLQSVLMVGIQLVLLKLALQHRPKVPLIPTNGNQPTVEVGQPTQWDRSSIQYRIMQALFGSTLILNYHRTIPPSEGVAKKRPFGFWIWDDERIYWTFLLRFCLWLTVFQFILGTSGLYVESLGLIGLMIEAILPLPQILTNASRGSVDGFRLSLLVSWVGGDVSKFMYLMTAENVAPQFVLSCVIQTLLDVFVGIQYFMYTTGRWKGTRQAQVTVKRQRADSLKRRRRASSIKRDGEIIEMSESTFN